MGHEKKKNLMSEDHDDHPPVHDESNWLVSYADMMTLLFGFFVLMYSLSKVDKQKFEVIQRDMAKYMGGTSLKENISKVALDKLKGTMLSQGLKIGTEGDFELSRDFDSIVLNMKENILFAPGKAELSPESEKTLIAVSKVLVGFKSISELHIEGHTDDSPMKSEYFPSNWELSAARSARVARLFEAGGLKSQNIFAEGYGSARPLLPNRNEKGQPIFENQNKNRRVIIRILMGSPEDTKKLSGVKDSPFEIKVAPPMEKTDEIVNPELETGKTMDLEQRHQQAQEKLKAAQVKLVEAQTKLREEEAARKKTQKIEDLENKVKALESKAQDIEVKTKELKIKKQIER